MPKPQFGLPRNFTSEDVQKFVEELGKTLLNLSLGDGTEPRSDGQNLDLVKISSVTVGVNADFNINHTLGRIPIGYIVISKNAACDIYNGTTAWTSAQITLKGTVAGVNFKILLF